MSTADHNSSLGYRFGPDATSAGGAARQDGQPSIWLDGDVLACACPDCAAPMSIRLWLMLADCWRCGASFELTAEQEREAQRLLRQRDAKREQASASNPTPTVAPSAPQTKPATPAVKRPQSAPARPAAKRVNASPAAPKKAVPRAAPAAAKPGGVRAQLAEISSLGEARLWLSRLMRELPAWLASLILHMLLIILLGLLLIQDTPKPPRITLATSISDADAAGTEPVQNEPVDAFEFEDPGSPVAEDVAADDPFQMTALDPFDVSLPQPVGAGPLLAESVAPPLGPLEPGNIFAGRDPRLRKQLLEREGGTDYTEAAVARGLKWLARHQNADGSWSLDRFHKTGDCDGQCDMRGQPSDTAATALALLPFLGAGETHRTGVYMDAVRRGIYWLVDHQRPSGDLRGNGIGRMYAHGQCAIVLCEAYALSRDEELREPAQKAIDFIVAAQHKQGGWRYSPGQAGDTSVVGWQLMALRSAQMAYLNVPKRTLDLSGRFLDRVKTDSRGGRYGYMPGHGASHTMTAEALLCRQYAGWPRDHAGMRAGVEYLITRHLPRRDRPSIYYWYYATQVMHHYGGDEWQTWNYALRDILVETQKTRGHEAGSWDLRDPYSGNGGRLYVTALAICTLEVYYRHLPLYQTTAVDE